MKLWSLGTRTRKKESGVGLQYSDTHQRDPLRQGFPRGPHTNAPSTITSTSGQARAPPFLHLGGSPAPPTPVPEALGAALRHQPGIFTPTRGSPLPRFPASERPRRALIGAPKPAGPFIVPSRAPIRAPRSGKRAPVRAKRLPSAGLCKTLGSPRTEGGFVNPDFSQATSGEGWASEIGQEKLKKKKSPLRSGNKSH